MNKLTPEQITMTYNRIAGTHYTVDAPEIDRAALRDIIALAWKKTDDGQYYTYTDIQKKSAVQCLEIVRRRPFPNNNVKTAILSTITMLELNGIYLKLDAEQTAELFHRLGDPQAAYDEISEWIRSHTLKSME